MTNLFIHSSHVLSSAEQILLEYLDQPRSKTASKCEFGYFTLLKIIYYVRKKDNVRTGEWERVSRQACESCRMLNCRKYTELGYIFGCESSPISRNVR